MPRFSHVRSVKPINKNMKSNSQAYKLLLEYRLTIWRKSALEAVPGMQSNALSACRKQIDFTNELVATLKGNKRFGDKLYWIIYITYMSNRQPCDVAEILSDIARKHESIPRSTYFRLRNRAITIMGNRLTEISNKEERNAI